MENKTEDRRYRILLADDDGQVTFELKTKLGDRGLEVRSISSGDQIEDVLHDWVPDFIIADLLLPGMNAMAMIALLNAEEKYKKLKIKVIVTSKHNSLQNVKQCLAAGAMDYITKPFRPEDMVSRILFHTQRKRQISDMAPVITEVGTKTPTTSMKDVMQRQLKLMDFILQEALSAKPPEEILFNLARMSAMLLEAVRCNIVECDPLTIRGIVQASHDSRDARGFVHDLNVYPEVMHVMNTEKLVVIDLDIEPSMADVKKKAKQIQFSSMIVSPLIVNGSFFGVMSARMTKTFENLTESDALLAKLIAQVVSLVISRHFEVLSLARFENPRQVLENQKKSA